MPLAIEIMIELTNQQEKMTQYCAPCVMLIIVILVKHMLHFFLIYVVFNERNEIRSALQVSLIHITLFIIISCTFHSVGTAAGEQKFNSICILSLNIINEKVLFVLFVFVFVLFVSAFSP